MYHNATQQLLDYLKPYINNATITISSDKGSDFVTIDEKNNVGFEVFDNEIIVFYFTDHQHFEDYSSELEDGEENFIKRAMDFLSKLLQYSIRHICCYKGKRISSEKYCLVYGNGMKDEYIGSTWFGLVHFINPFAKKSIQSNTYQYDSTTGCFTSRTSKKPDPNAVTVIDINDDCYVEIFKSNKAYTYQVMKTYFDDRHGTYYWAPVDLIPSGFYASVEQAAHEALSMLSHCILEES